MSAVRVPKMRCSACKRPLDPTDDVEVVCVTDDTTEVALSCYECGEKFSAWIDHNKGWADSLSNPVDLTVAKGGKS